MDAAKRLKELRLAKNLTTTELASLCMMQQSTISKLENNRQTIDIPTLITICGVLGISLADFFYYAKLPVHIHELMETCKMLTPEQIHKVTLAIKSLINKQ